MINVHISRDLNAFDIKPCVEYHRSDSKLTPFSRVSQSKGSRLPTGRVVHISLGMQLDWYRAGTLIDTTHRDERECYMVYHGARDPASIPVCIV